MSKALRIALIADTFPPLRTSGAVQLRDLSREFARQGHALTVILPSPDLREAWRLEETDGFQVLRLKAPRTKDIGYLRRTIAEFLMPFAMRKNLRESPLADARWDGVVWYAPSIFHGPLAKTLKTASDCKGYLIIRDIFPEWAVDMGLMGRGVPYRFFDAIAQYQYSVADVIGVQSPGNRRYFQRWAMQPGRRLEILQNWLDQPVTRPCAINLAATPLRDKKIFVYAGNMGVAQGLDILLDVAARLTSRSDVGFLFVGRGSDAKRLRAAARERRLSNVIFFDEIHPDEIPALYSQCAAGIVALDPRHKSHNIPGKFLTYMQCGLPVLANLNTGNDLADLIRSEDVGEVCESNSATDIENLALKLIDRVNVDQQISARCRELFDREFSVTRAVSQIANAFSQ
jgi:glycosyltransferase involved in cell wall biosynthesis